MFAKSVRSTYACEGGEQEWERLHARCLHELDLLRHWLGISLSRGRLRVVLC
jgi:hypothetical protein